MKKNLFFLLILMIGYVCGQNFNITKCSDLQLIIPNNSTVHYFLVNDINCNGFPFNVIGNSTQPFKGNKNLYFFFAFQNTNLFL